MTINHQTAEAIEENIGRLAEAVVDLQYRLQPEIWGHYGPKGRELGIRDMGYHFPYLTESLKASDPSGFVNYVLWLKELFAGLDFPANALPLMLECMQETLRDSLPSEMSQAAAEYIRAAFEKLGQVSVKEETFIADTAPHADLAREYLNALLQSNRDQAAKLIMEAVDKGLDVKDIYLYVFQAAMYEIGRLWHSKQVTVAQEHYCSAATERIMSQLYGKIFTTQRLGLSYIGACVGGELHQMGARMVADFFEMEGWDTYYMGANTPAASILQAVSEHKADILGISCTMSFHRSAAEELIRSVRESADTPENLKIIVGGYSFIKQPGLWKEIGADGTASDAAQALIAAKRLILQSK